MLRLINIAPGTKNVFRSIAFPTLRFTLLNQLETRYSYSQQHNGSKKPRYFRRFLLVSLVTTCAFGGLFYANESVRDSSVAILQKIKPLQEHVSNLTGNWFSKSDSQDSFSFPMGTTKKKDKVSEKSKFDDFFVTDKNEEQQVESISPIETNTEQMAEKPRFDHGKVNLDTLLGDARKSIKKIDEKLNELEVISENYFKELDTAIQQSGSSTVPSSILKLEKNKSEIEKQIRTLVQNASDYLEQSHSSIEKLQQSPEASSNDGLVRVVSEFGAIKYDLSGLINRIRTLQNDEAILKRYLNSIPDAHADLKSDLNVILEQTNTEKNNSSNSSLTHDDLNELITIAHRRIRELQKKLNNAESNERQRLKAVLDYQKLLNDALVPEIVRRELELQQNKHEIEKHRWMEQSRKQTDFELKQALARHSDHLSQILQIEKDKMEHQYSFKLRESLAQEKVVFEAALAGWTKRMEAIEHVVDGRAELDRITKESHKLWLASEAFASKLLLSTSFINSRLNHVDGINAHHGVSHTGPLEVYVNAINEVASQENYPFVTVLTNHLSPNIVTNGVWIEDGLKKRFDKVYKVCRSVSLVDETSGSLWLYALSWLQSLIMFDVKNQYYQTMSRLNSKYFNNSINLTELDESKLNTFELLSAAKLSLNSNLSMVSDDSSGGEIREGDSERIETAIRLLNQLKGQARLVAQDWINDAIRYLEVKQTSQALLVYAYAHGISTYEKRL